MHCSKIPSSGLTVQLNTRIRHRLPTGSVDVMLPAMHLHKLALLKKDSLSMNSQVRTWLGRYRNRLLRAANANSSSDEYRSDGVLRCRYQKQGLKLHRVSMRVESEVWLELKILSLTARCSMSLILVLMIQWEYTRRYKFALRGWVISIEGCVGTPTKSQVCLSFNEKTRIYRLSAYFSKSTPLQLPHWYRPAG
jgi:hypothetical protein